MVALSRFVLRHRVAVGLFWLVVFVAGAATAGQVQERLSTSFSVPGTESYEANQAILAAYGNGGEGYPQVAVVTLPPGVTVDSPGVADQLGRAFAAAAEPQGLRVADYASTGDRRFVSADGRTTFGLLFTPPTSPFAITTVGPAIAGAMRGALPAGATLHVTSLGELIATGASTEGTGLLVEVLLGALGALAVLAFVFGSLLAAVPLLAAAVAILSTFLVVLALTTVTEVSIIVQYIVALIGLGVALDYSLLVVTRWREELAAGHDQAEAARRSLVSAGRAVVFSGITVAVSLLALVFLPVPYLRSMGYGGMLIPVVSVLVNITLLPVMLATVGRRVDWPRRRGQAHASRGWTAWAAGVVRHRWLAALAALALLVVIGLPALDLEIGEPRAAALAGSSPAGAGLRELERGGLPTGVLTPIEVLVPAGTAPEAVAARLEPIAGVHAVAAPDGPAWRRGGGAVLDVLPVEETSTPGGEATLGRVREAAAGLPGVAVGGGGAALVDSTAAFYDRFPLMLAAITVITFVLLVRAFRSLLLPAKAVALNLLSVAATYGVLVTVWQRGNGSDLIWGVPATDAITNWIPLMTFAFLFGLSMDYEVFILSRMREAYDRSGSTTTAIVEGIGRTGRLVTSAALILFFALAALASGPGTDIKVAATGLGAGILLDATVVRALLLPALVSLFGRWNWWLPAWAARPLGVAPSPATRERAPAAPPPPGGRAPSPAPSGGQVAPPTARAGRGGHARGAGEEG